jgi:hypothetical protein
MTEVCRLRNRMVYMTKSNSVSLKTAVFLSIVPVSSGRDPSPRPPLWVKVLTFLYNLPSEPSRFCNLHTRYVTVSSRVQTGFYINTPRLGSGSRRYIPVLRPEPIHFSPENEGSISFRNVGIRVRLHEDTTQMNTIWIVGILISWNPLNSSRMVM